MEIVVSVVFVVIGLCFCVYLLCLSYGVVQQGKLDDCRPDFLAECERCIRGRQLKSWCGRCKCKDRVR